MTKFLTPAVRKAVYTALAALGAVVVGFGLVDPADAERLIALAMSVIGLLMAAHNTDVPTAEQEPSPQHAIDEETGDHGSTVEF